MTPRTSPWGQVIQSALQAFMAIRDMQLAEEREGRLAQNAERTARTEEERLALERKRIEAALADREEAQLRQRGMDAIQFTAPYGEVDPQLIRDLVAKGSGLAPAFKTNTAIAANEIPGLNLEMGDSSSMPARPTVDPAPREYGIRLPTFAEQQKLDEIRKVEEGKAKALALLSSIRNPKQRELARAAIETGQNLPANLFEDPEADWAQDKRRMDYSAQLARDTQAIARNERMVRRTWFDPTTQTTYEEMVPANEFNSGKGGPARKAPPPAIQQRLSYMKQAVSVVKQLEELSKKINTLNGVAQTAVGFTEQQKAKVNLNEALTRYEGILNSNLPILARARGEVGNLAEPEQMRQKLGLPNAKTGKDIAGKMFQDYTRPIFETASQYGIDLGGGGPADPSAQVVTTKEIVEIAKRLNQTPEQVRQAMIARGLKVQ